MKRKRKMTEENYYESSIDELEAEANAAAAKRQEAEDRIKEIKKQAEINRKDREKAERFSDRGSVRQSAPHNPSILVVAAVAIIFIGILAYGILGDKFKSDIPPCPVCEAQTCSCAGSNLTCEAQVCECPDSNVNLTCSDINIYTNSS